MKTLTLTLFTATLYAQTPTRLPITAFVGPPGATSRLLVILPTGEPVFAELSSTGTGQLTVVRDPLTGVYRLNVDALSVTIAPKIVIGQVLPIVAGMPQLVSFTQSLTAPVIHRNGLRLSEHRDYELQPVLGAPTPTFNVQLLPKVPPIDPADSWICDYLA